MPPRAHRLPALAVAASVWGGLAAPGCASGDRLDIEGAEREIERELDSRFDIRLATLDCPPEVIVEDGAGFDCTGADRRGHRYEVAVELIGTDGRFTFSRPKRDREG